MDRCGYDNPSHVSVEGHLEKNERPFETGSLTTRTNVSVEEHLGKNERPLETGSLTTGTVVQDGPSCVRRSVTCVRWDRILGLGQWTLRWSVVGTTVRHRGLVLSDNGRTKGTLSSPDEPTSNL